MLEIVFLMGLGALFCVFIGVWGLKLTIKDIQARLAKIEADRERESSIHIPTGPMQGTWKPEEDKS